MASLSRSLSLSRLLFLSVWFSVVTSGMGDCCVQLVNECGQFEVGTKLIALAYDGQSDGLFTVVDINNSLYEKCSARKMQRVWQSECPSDEVESTGFALSTISCVFLLAVLVSSLCALYLCGAQVYFWLTLVMYWAADLNAGIAAGCLAQLMSPSRGSINMEQILTTMVLELLFYDWPMLVMRVLVNKCCCGPASAGMAFNTVACILGSFCAYCAASWAYQPSNIVMIGHYPLVLGFINFFLDFPKKILGGYLRATVCSSCSSQDKPYVTELPWFFKEISEPLPEAITKKPDGDSFLAVGKTSEP
eukprot:TRINITY_DN14083_c0_g1_i5.p1 TRINITY_DN14083_c0_g1~~TRINITY_DN14083_c0_g1_i5.p1  ORF type:complete len:305 (-),score=31.10 TRINITY_DN14083_c0_g1_i5:58-972(-)